MRLVQKARFAQQYTHIIRRNKTLIHEISKQNSELKSPMPSDEPTSGASVRRNTWAILGSALSSKSGRSKLGLSQHESTPYTGEADQNEATEEEMMDRRAMVRKAFTIRKSKTTDQKKDNKKGEW